MMQYEVKITAIGEVRDKDGNLIELVPIESVQIMSEDEIASMKEEIK